MYGLSTKRYACAVRVPFVSSQLLALNSTGTASVLKGSPLGCHWIVPSSSFGGRIGALCKARGLVCKVTNTGSCQ